MSDKSDPQGLLKVGTNAARCAVCGEYFTGDQPFRRHRTGDYDAGRRCLSIEEMRAIGMILDERGRWQYGTALKNRPVAYAQAS